MSPSLKENEEGRVLSNKKEEIDSPKVKYRN